MRSHADRDSLLYRMLSLLGADPDSISHTNLIEGLLRAFERQCRRVCVLFDNLEHVESAAPSVLAALAEICGACPVHVTVVLCSRERIPRGIYKAFLPHEVVHIDEGQLLLAQDEAAALLRERLGEVFVADGLQIAGGNPLLLTVYVEACRSAQVPLSQAGSTAGIARDLIQRVLSIADRKVLKLLIWCSVLPELTIRELELLFGRETMSTAGRLPFVRFGPHGRVAIHPLAAQTLLPDDIARQRIRKAAARVLLYSKHYERAAELFLANGDFNSAALALGEERRFLDGTPSLAFANVVRCIPPAILLQHPLVWGLYYLLWGPPEREPTLSEVTTICNALPAMQSFEAKLASVNTVASMTGRRGDVAGMESVIDWFEADVRTNHASELENDRYRSVVGIFRVFLRMLRGKRVSLREYYDAVPRANRTQSLYWASMVTTTQAPLLFLHGRRDRQRVLLESTLEWTRSLGNTDHILTISYACCYWAWLSGEDERIESYLSSRPPLSQHPLARTMFNACAGLIHDHEVVPRVWNIETPVFLMAAAASPDWIEHRRHLERAMRSADRIIEDVRNRSIVRVAALAALPDLRVALEPELTELAGVIEFEPFRTAVERAVRHGRECGILQPLYERFERAGARASGAQALLSSGSVQRAGKPVNLSARELELVLLLALRGRAHRIELEDLLWRGELSMDTPAVRVLVNRLRAKLGADAIVTAGGGIYEIGNIHIDFRHWEDRIQLARRMRTTTPELTQALAVLAQPQPEHVAGYAWVDELTAARNRLRIALHALIVEAEDGTLAPA